MLNRFLLGLFVGSLLIACTHKSTVSAASARANATEIDLHVNSARVPCTGASPQTCFQVKRDSSAAEWELFYGSIEGFEYRPGQLYHLRVSQIELDPATVPADGSALSYELVRVISASPDTLLRLTDTWALVSIEGDEIEVPEGSRRPTLELDVSGRKVRGTDGCNNYSGEIKTLDDARLGFGPLLSTRMACPDMVLTNRFNENMLGVRGYRSEAGVLVLLGERGEELLRLRHVD